ncbi:ankyrin repeat-containing domain protein [Aspergillus karnatakaensis]|uniref:ankyrin repeat-containing domain protein n=1 Tax=Aspergillus karnatakaensis TaxID=1810916 RepID=UPI003CCE1BE2
MSESGRELISLAEEIILNVCTSLSKADLATFIQTCRTLNRIGTEVLYNTLTGDLLYEVYQWAQIRGLTQTMLDTIPAILRNPPMAHRLEINLLRLAIGNGVPSMPGTSYPTVIAKLLEHGVSPHLDAPHLTTELTPLMQIARDGQNPDCLAVVQQLLAAGAGTTINYINNLNHSALHCAAFGGNVAVMTELINAGANVNLYQNISRITPLRSAVCAGHLPAVQLLVSRGADVNIAEIYGWTPLMAAAEGQKLSILNFLLQSGANPDARKHDGKTALHIAVLFPYLNIVQALVDAGCDCTLKDDSGRLAVDFCHGPQDEAIKAAIEKGPSNPSQWGSA